MRRLIIDTSSVLWMSLLAGKSAEFGRIVEFEGKSVHVNGWEYGVENAVSHITAVARDLGFHAGQMIFVVEGKMSKARRTCMFEGYKASRGSRPEEAYLEFNKCKDALIAMFRAAGASAVTQDGVEGDDVIAYLVANLDGDKVILTQDGDMAVLMSNDVQVFRNGKLLTDNPFGPFPTQNITVYKALVGDSSDNIKGAHGFGDKAFLNMLVWGGDGVLPAIEGVILRRELHTLEDDVAEFKPMRKIIDCAESVYTSYELAKLYPEWVNSKRVPLVVEPATPNATIAIDERIERLKGTSDDALCEKFVAPVIVKQHVVFDCELIGLETPVFLVCMKNLETGERNSFWLHNPQDVVAGELDADMVRLKDMLQRQDLTFISFNGIHFDAPLIWAALGGRGTRMLKQAANAIIVENEKAYGLADRFGYDKSPDFDHIDLYEVAPGVQISLKTFAGRMHYPTMVDMPFHHDTDLTADQLPELESYCQNDLGVTEMLFDKLRTEIELRKEMSIEHGIDLRSKSDAQVAEAILKKAANIKKRGEMPLTVTYKAPAFIASDSDTIQVLVGQLEDTVFKINPANGQVETPEFLKEPLQLGYGMYQCGIGGLHSTHDKQLHVQATDEVLVSDFDVASYYPNIMLKAGLTPQLEGGAGERFIAEYRNIYDKRMEAKRAGNKKVANALKIALNGTFGKLGSMFASFYSPDLMLAVTLTGQLNLMCLIYDLEYNPAIKVLSANTDGIMVQYPAAQRDRVLDTIKRNAVRTGFEYEETRYATVAMKDVNNYLAVTRDGEAAVIQPDGEVKLSPGKAGIAKRKGLYASNDPKENPLFLMKNPTFQVCSNMVVDYLRNGIHPSIAIEIPFDTS